MGKGAHHDWNGWSYSVLDRSEQAKRGGETAAICEARAEFQSVRSSSYGPVQSRSCIMSRRKTVRPGVVRLSVEGRAPTNAIADSTESTQTSKTNTTISTVCIQTLGDCEREFYFPCPPDPSL